MKRISEMVAQNSRERVPLGTLLIADDLILPQDLNLALDHQRYTKQLIGEILVRFGALNRDDLDTTLKIQNATPSH